MGYARCWDSRISGPSDGADGTVTVRTGGDGVEFFVEISE
jgi:hypothetical protein